MEREAIVIATVGATKTTSRKWIGEPRKRGGKPYENEADSDDATDNDDTSSTTTVDEPPKDIGYIPKEPISIGKYSFYTLIV